MYVFSSTPDFHVLMALSCVIEYGLAPEEVAGAVADVEAAEVVGASNSGLCEGWSLV